MQQLSGLDATFLYAELDKSPMHIGPLMIYDPSTAPGGFVRFKDILRTFEERLDRSPVFRRKLATVPLNLDQPYWTEDENFDLEFHVRHIALPKPGDWRQLCILVARLHARPLDRARPLWEAYVIEGLDNVKGFPQGSFAIFLKIHHAAIDGATGTEIVAAIHDLTREPPPPRPAGERSAVTAPSLPEMLWRAYLANLKAPLRLARLATRGVPAWRRVHDGVKAKRFHNLPSKAHTRFNNAVTPHRVFGAADFELSVIRRAREGVEGATVNDVILTIVGGALRKYLSLHDELPDLSLVAGAPVNVRGREEQGAGGNVVSMMAVSLRTDVEDFVERLQAVHGEAVSSKAYHQAVGARMMTDLTQSVPAELAALAVRSALASGLMAEMKPIFNTIVTNVPGPQIPLYMGGAEVVRSYGLGPCADGLGLFHAVTSYNGQICISFQACRTQLPDPAVYEQCLDDVYRELQACFPARPGGKKPAPVKIKAVAGKGSGARSAAKKPAAKKATAKKATAKKATAKKATAKKATAKRAAARKAPARGKTAREAAPREAAPRKAAPRKAAPKKSVRPKHAKQ